MVRECDCRSVAASQKPTVSPHLSVVVAFDDFRWRHVFYFYHSVAIGLLSENHTELEAANAVLVLRVRRYE